VNLISVHNLLSNVWLDVNVLFALDASIRSKKVHTLYKLDYVGRAAR
jgi:hypothetical protein